QC
ncbi:hypothetical protein D046_5053B, partial [Vibrio parahaemolyticus V-223/04]